MIVKINSERLCLRMAGASSNQFLSKFILVNRGGRIYLSSNFSILPLSISLNSDSVLFLQTNALALLLHIFSMSSLVVLAFSLQTPTLFSERAQHPSIFSTHARTISLHIHLCHLNCCFLQS